MYSTLETIGAFASDPLRDSADAATILDIVTKTKEWRASVPHAKNAFKVMRRYAMEVWERGRYPGEKIWRLGSSGLPWSPAAHALVTAVPGRGGKNRFSFDGLSKPSGGLTLEHVVPSDVIHDRLDEARDVTDVIDVLHNYYRVAVVTSDEGTAVRPKSAMPVGWNGVDLWARYRDSYRPGTSGSGVKGIGFEVEDMLIGPTFDQMRPVREWVSGGASLPCEEPMHGSDVR